MVVETAASRFMVFGALSTVAMVSLVGEKLGMRCHWKQGNARIEDRPAIWRYQR